MNKLLEVFAECFGLLFTVVLVLAIFFLFEGEPDVWDKLHAAAMGLCK